LREVGCCRLPCDENKTKQSKKVTVWGAGDLCGLLATAEVVEAKEAADQNKRETSAKDNAPLLWLMVLLGYMKSTDSFHGNGKKVKSFWKANSVALGTKKFLSLKEFAPAVTKWVCNETGAAEADLHPAEAAGMLSDITRLTLHWNSVLSGCTSKLAAFDQQPKLLALGTVPPASNLTFDFDVPPPPIKPEVKPEALDLPRARNSRKPSMKLKRASTGD